MELTQDEIIDQLRSLGRSEVSLIGTTPKFVRGRLIGAARFAGIRVSVTRDDEKNAMVATVLTAEEAVLQARRSARFRAARQLRSAIEILETELDEQGREESADLLFDLKEMFGELEEG